MFLSMLGACTGREKRVSIMTSLSILLSAEAPQPVRAQSKGLRKRFHYYIPFLGKVCKQTFLLCYKISAATVARYKPRLEGSRAD
jgi:hypothetical protein